MNDEKYYLNNKLYNITKSVQLYEYIKREPSGLMIMGQYAVTREVRHRIYMSPKENLFKTIVRGGRISIIDINENDFKDILLSNNALDVLSEIYPLEYQRLEEC